MKRIKIPQFTMTEAVQRYVENPSRQVSRPLNICNLCRHVKCNCGNCHSQICRETCAYEANSTSSASDVSTSSTGRVWCEQCGGNYLPHEH